MKTFSEWLQEHDPEMAESFMDRVGRIKDRVVALPSMLGKMAARTGGLVAGSALGSTLGPAGTVIGGLTGLLAGTKADKMLTSDAAAARAMKKT